MRVSEIDLVSPLTLKECLEILHCDPRAIRLIAGGTDTVVQMKEGKVRPEAWVNIKALKELRYVQETDGEIHIGPLCTHSDIAGSPIIQAKATTLAQACWEVGATQIRNMGTIGGNLATASPAGDTIPALYVLDAQLELQSLLGKRIVRLEEFYLGPRRTTLQKGEMITKIIVRPQAENEISIFQKLGPRKAQAISIVNVAIHLIMGSSERECMGGKIAFGSVAPTVIRARKCEGMLTISRLTDDIIHDIGSVAKKEVAPITDIRATASYRQDMAGALLERGLYRLVRRWESR